MSSEISSSLARDETDGLQLPNLFRKFTFLLGSSIIFLDLTVEIIFYI